MPRMQHVTARTFCVVVLLTWATEAWCGERPAENDRAKLPDVAVQPPELVNPATLPKDEPPGVRKGCPTSNMRREGGSGRPAMPAGRSAVWKARAAIACWPQAATPPTAAFTSSTIIGDSRSTWPGNRAQARLSGPCFAKRTPGQGGPSATMSAYAASSASCKRYLLLRKLRHEMVFCRCAVLRFRELAGLVRTRRLSTRTAARLEPA